LQRGKGDANAEEGISKNKKEKENSGSAREGHASPSSLHYGLTQGPTIEKCAINRQVVKSKSEGGEDLQRSETRDEVETGEKVKRGGRKGRLPERAGPLIEPRTS